MGFITKEMMEYLDAFAKYEDGELGQLQQQAYEEGLPIITKDVVNFLNTMLTMKRPKKILEIGCAVGFSAMLFAQFAPVITIERFPLMAVLARKNFDNFNMGKRIKLIHQCASIALPDLVAQKKKFDFIFMDCGKGQYSRFFPYLLELLEDGGVICVDDVLQEGTVASDVETIPRRLRTIHRNLNEFLHTAASHPRLQSTILPIGDGLLVCTKITDKANEEKIP
ncbi:MAG: O-methyltransferase [Defluviitaleaceae bacterium]|nr:O-methyltransferase [Defluviitaleaceae bacterium]